MLEFPPYNENVLPHRIKLVWPSTEMNESTALDRIVGSLVGLAVGDALGASVEFRPHEYLVAHPIREMMAGGTWGLQAGQWTDDTSMALCLASSLISQQDFNDYDQMVRYKWWYQFGYLSSTGRCFDIGNATRNSIEEFYRRQKRLMRDYNIWTDAEIDRVDQNFLKQIQFDANCSKDGVAGNGALMRLAPVPLFYYRIPALAVEYSGKSARLTHGDKVAVDACRYYGALIVAAIHGESKKDILNDQFYNRHQDWFGTDRLHDDIINIARGSFKRRRGYKDGIRGKGHIVWALEAALWAFWNSDSFEKGALDAVNLGDDTDTTAAIYGQLAGAYYGSRDIPRKWIDQLYANQLIICIAQWLHFLSPSSNRAREQQNQSRGRSQQSRFTNIELSDRPQPGINEKPKQVPRRERAKSAHRPSTNFGSLFGCASAHMSTEV